MNLAYTKIKKLSERCEHIREHSQSFCMSMITSAVVFGSNELSCGHLYGDASILESILDSETVAIVKVRRFLRLRCIGRAETLRLSDALEGNKPKQLRRLRRERFAGVSAPCFGSSSLLIRWTSFELVPLGGAVGEVASSILRNLMLVFQEGREQGKFEHLNENNRKEK